MVEFGLEMLEETALELEEVQQDDQTTSQSITQDDTSDETEQLDLGGNTDTSADKKPTTDTKKKEAPDPAKTEPKKSPVEEKGTDEPVIKKTEEVAKVKKPSSTPTPAKTQEPITIKQVHCKVSKKLADITAIKEELDKAQSMLTDIQKTAYDRTMQEALLKSIILHYMKAFSSARGTFSLQISKTGIDGQLVDFHKSIIEKRFKDISNGDSLSSHLQTIVIVSNQDNTLQNVETVSLQRQTSEDVNLDKFMTLITTIKQVIESEHSQAFDKVFEKYSQELPA